MERRLTAIFALDMVGYSRLMELDEADTLTRQESVRAQLIDPTISRHHGRLVKSTGDGLLVEFASAVDAVECAAEIQREMAERETDVPKERRIEFRIGINVGDIVARDGDIYGDGVNVAARIESLADPGGILISDSAYDQVQNKVKLGFEDIGSHAVKNLERPVHVYRVLLDPTAASTPPGRAGRRYRRLGLAVLLAVAALIGAWQILFRPTSVEAVPSIAVLPFADMSPDGDQEYFSDGISEELLNLLGKIPELRVAARTSSFSFKGQNLEISEIAERLNVAYVLEGSVRKADDEVRITVQLIRADDGYHVWSDTWNRTLDDIFTIQDEIAAAVVDELKLTLLGGPPEAESTDAEAFTLFLQARYLAAQGTAEDYERAIELYHQVLAIAPDYARAWRGLAVTYLNQGNKGLRTRAESRVLAREALDEALAIDPDYSKAHSLLGMFSLALDGDLEAAASHFKHALSTDPTDLSLLSNSSSLLLRLGRLDETIAVREYDVSRDPLDPVGYNNLAWAYLMAGQPDGAISCVQTLATLAPNYGGARNTLGRALLLKGEHEAALEAMLEEPSEVWRLLGLVVTYHTMGRGDESDATLAELIEKYGDDRAYHIAMVLAHRGEADRAFEWLDRAARDGSPSLSYIAVETLFSNIHSDPRWLPFLESIGKSPEQLAAIEFEVTLPQ
jgi:TolB-like protein/class 3 adenylate cyclase/Flp pilus assembly protein TadD